LVIHRLAQDAAPEMRAELMQLVDEMKNLEPRVTKARYPILSGQNLLPPSEYYTREMAQELLTRARKALLKAKTIMDSALEQDSTRHV
jgi:HEPN domain-containing protein